MRLFKLLLAIGSASMLAACPAPPSQPASPSLSWGVLDSTSGEKVPIESGNTATVVSDHLVQVFLYINDSQGVGTSTMSATATQIQCGYKAIRTGRGVTTATFVKVGLPFDRKLPAQTHSYTSNYPFQFNVFAFNYTEEGPTFIHLCPASYPTSDGPAPGGELSGSVTITGSATNRGTPASESSSVFHLNFTPGE
jgi:hypothetical protein